MTAFVRTGEGQLLELPVSDMWEFHYGLGLPCDHFVLRFPWEGELPASLDTWSLFQGYEGEQLVFTGVIDEVEGRYSSTGAVMELSGRGMAARLLDNDSLGQEYMTATLGDILSNYVYPFGVTVGERDDLPSLSPFVVETGSSAWTVVDQFCCYYSDVVPRFGWNGDLVLTTLSDSPVWEVKEDTAISELEYCWKRYGACSEYWVRDRVSREVNKVYDQEQIALGLCRRGVSTTTSGSTHQKRSYDGTYRLEESQTEMLRIRITVPWLEFLETGTLVQVSTSACPYQGRYRLLELEVGVSVGKGAYTTMTLGEGS